MPDFATQLNGFEAMYDRVFNILDDYPEHLQERGGACGIWSPKQIVAHFSGWLVDASTMFANWHAGVRHPVDYSAKEIHAYNAQSVEERANLDWNSTLEDLKTCYKDFVEKLAQVPAEEKHNQDAYGAWLDALHEDCEEHYQQLQDFKEGQPA